MSQRPALRILMSLVISWFTVVALALLPVFNGYSQLAPSFPPDPAVVLRDTAIVVVIASVCFLMIVAVTRDSERAAVSLALTLLPFGFYAASRRLLPPGIAAHERVFATLYVVCCCLAGFWVRVLKPESRRFALNILTLVAIVFSSNAAIQFWLRAHRAERPTAFFPQDPFANLPTVADTSALPDVYHLIMDEFGRPDVLRAMYGVDVSPLVQQLQARGFEISDDRGIANYTQTYLSIASMLNGEYLQAAKRLVRDDYSRRPMHHLIQESAVLRAAKRVGYRILFFGSIYSATQRHALADECYCDSPLVGEFESMIIRNTPFAPIGFRGLDYRPHRNKIRRTLSALESLEASTQPRLLIAHIMAPHPPFVFDAAGGDVHASRAFDFSEGTLFTGSPEEYQHGYAQQVAFVASQVPRLVDHLAAVSRARHRDYVIIVSGDHGPRQYFDHLDPRRTNAVEVMPILLGIRWPASCGPNPRHSESLVNVYRAFFANCFGASIEPLPDRAYVSSFARPYDFVLTNPALVRANGF